MPDRPGLEAEALVDRASELAALDAVIEAARTGVGAAALVTGDAGTGKTALLDAARDVAAQRGLRVLRARGSELDQPHAYATVHALLTAAVREAGDRDLWTDAAALARPVFVPSASDAGVEDVDGAAFARRQGLYWLLVALTERTGPLVLLVDDAQWADDPSARFLAHLASRLGGLPVALIVAARPLTGAAPDSALLALELDPDVTAMALGTLGADGTRSLVEAALGPDGAVLADACHAASGGNPLLLRELLGDLRSRPQLPAPGEIERIGVPTIGARVQRALAGADPGAVALARAIAVLADDVAVEDAVGLAGLEPERASPALAALLDTALVTETPLGALGFVHPVVHASVLASIGPLDRRALHARAAQRLHERAPADERIPAHLLAAGPSAESWTAAALRRGADRALELGHPSEAVRYLRRVLSDGDGRDPALLAALARAEAAAGDPAAVDTFTAAMTAEEDPAGTLGLALELAGALSMGARAGEAFENFERLRRELDERLMPPVRLAARVAAHGLALWSRSPAALAVRDAHVAEAEAWPDWLASESPTDAERQLAADVAYELLIRGEPAPQARALTLRAFAGGRFPVDLGSSPAFGYGIWALVMTDAYDEALAELERAGRAARDAGGAVFAALCDALRALAHLRRGDLLAAEADAQQSLLLADLPSWRLGRIACSAFLVQARLEQGRTEDARAALVAVPDADARTDSNLTDLLAAARAQLLIAEGRSQEALAELEPLGARLERYGWRAPAFIPWRSLSAQALVALDRAEEARAQAALDVEAARASGTCGVLAAAQLQHALSAREPDAAELEEAAATAAGAGRAVVEARALLALGRVRRAAGARVEAREPLTRAVELAHRSGARALADEALDELAAAGARPRRVGQAGAATLTASEARVTSLAADGATNREIAQRLYVTQKTVEMHLRHAYRKLDVRSRSQLPAALAQA